MFLPSKPVPYLYAVALFFLPAFAYKAKAQNQKPNIIFILSDDIGYKTLTINGGTKYSTPNLDKMARQGMKFTGCHSSPVCSPSRNMLLTGKYNFRNYAEWGVLDRSQKTLGNMFKDAGYKTACYGKWQLDGGDTSIHDFGFDNYCVFHPFSNVSELLPKYKNPLIYTNDAYVPSQLTLNQYGPDIFADSAMNFIEQNKNNPFFIYYPMVLAHKPFQPTPNDPDFADWTSPTDSDTSYYRSMIEYMDKEVGRLVNKVKEAGLANNTLIIFTGDNGTPGIISNQDDEDDVRTGKATTLESGIRVPMIAYWPGTITPGSVNNDLIGFTDFLPTLADAANIPVPDYGPLDGVSFAPRLTGNPGTPREWLYYHYDPHPGEDGDSAVRWAQTSRYKLYDTSSSNATLLFYDVKSDTNQVQPIPNNLLTKKQAEIKQQLLDVINSYVIQTTPVLGIPVVLSLTDSSAITESLIGINGGPTINASGVVWSKQHNPVLSDNRTFENSYSGKFLSFLQGLNANTTYYIRTYARNSAGITYSQEIKVITPPRAPVCTNATNIKNTRFIANWNAVKGADNYRIDVSKRPSFSIPEPLKVTEGFDSGKSIVNGWIFNKELLVDTTEFGKASPSILFRNSGRRIVTTQYSGPATKLSFWIKGLSKKSGYLVVEGFDGLNWVVIDTVTDITKTEITKVYDANSSPSLKNNFIKFRFTYTRFKGSMAFDDVVINYTYAKPDLEEGYGDLPVFGNSQLVSGLKIGTKYYYRVRAQNINGISGNSNTISVITGDQPASQNDNLLRSKFNKQLLLNVSPNPAVNEFTLSVNTNDDGPISIVVTDLYGNKLYQYSGINNKKFVFGKNFASGTYFVRVMQGSNKSTAIKLIKSGK
jgi:arylsulfatase A